VLQSRTVALRNYNFVLHLYSFVYQLVKHRPIRHNLLVGRNPRVAHRKPDNIGRDSTGGRFLYTATLSAWVKKYTAEF